VIQHPTHDDLLVFIPDRANYDPSVITSEGYSAAGNPQRIEKMDHRAEIWAGLNYHFQAAIRQLMADGHKIAAVQLMRHGRNTDETMTLTDAKNLVEQYAQ
jgi:hypothetical protein